MVYRAFVRGWRRNDPQNSSWYLHNLLLNEADRGEFDGHICLSNPLLTALGIMISQIGYSAEDKRRKKRGKMEEHANVRKG
jgi:hypothetical protein